jgi:hypothetical protein
MASYDYIAATIKSSINRPKCASTLHENEPIALMSMAHDKQAGVWQEEVKIVKIKAAF